MPITSKFLPFRPMSSTLKFHPFCLKLSSLFLSDSSSSDEAVFDFHRLFRKRHVPPMIEFGRILGSLCEAEGV